MGFTKHHCYWFFKDPTTSYIDLIIVSVPPMSTLTLVSMRAISGLRESK